MLKDFIKIIGKAKHFLIWLIWDFSGYAMIKEKIKPSEPGKKSSFLFWFIGFYFALFGLAESRYLNQKNQLHMRLNFVLSRIDNEKKHLKTYLNQVADINRTQIPKSVYLDLSLTSLFSPFATFFNVNQDPNVVILTKSLLQENKMNLAGLYLAKNDLKSIELRNAVLNQAALSWAKLNETDLSLAVLENAVLNQTVLIDASLIGANLKGADLKGANLKGANLEGADLSWADLRGADLEWVDLNWVDISIALLRGLLFSRAERKEKMKFYLMEALKATTNLADIKINNDTNFQSARFDRHTILPFSKKLAISEHRMTFVD